MKPDTRMTSPDLYSWPPVPPTPSRNALTREADTWPRHKARARKRQLRHRITNREDHQ